MPLHFNLGDRMREREREREGGREREKERERERGRKKKERKVGEETNNSEWVFYKEKRFNLQKGRKGRKRTITAYCGKKRV